jgi:hypothetical protein
LIFQLLPFRIFLELTHRILEVFDAVLLELNDLNQHVEFGHFLSQFLIANNKTKSENHRRPQIKINSRLCAEQFKYSLSLYTNELSLWASDKSIANLSAVDWYFRFSSFKSVSNLVPFYYFKIDLIVYHHEIPSNHRFP